MARLAITTTSGSSDATARSGGFVAELGPIEKIGTARTNTIVLPHGSAHTDHAAIEHRGDHYVLFNFAAPMGTYVGGERVRTGFELVDGDVIRLGGCEARFAMDTEERGLAFSPRDGVEADLVEAVKAQPHEAAPRLVYADWLEARGDVKRATFLRLLEARRASRAELDAAADADLGFRAFFSRGAVEACARAAVCKDRRWDTLQELGRADVRSCDVCGKYVRYCTSLNEARRNVVVGQPVVVDVSVARTPRDLVSWAPQSRFIEASASLAAVGPSVVVTQEGRARWLFPLEVETWFGFEERGGLTLATHRTPSARARLRSDAGVWYVDAAASGVLLDGSPLTERAELRHGHIVRVANEAAICFNSLRI